MDVQVIRYESASANLSLSSRSNSAFIGSLVAEERRRGHGTELLRLICERADAEGLDLLLTVGADGGPGDPDREALIRFYGRFGFEQMNPDNRYYLGRTHRLQDVAVAVHP